MQAPELVTVNTVAPYVLTALMDKPARLIHLSSSMHRTGSTDLNRMAAGAASYGDSKLWVTALALACASRGEGTMSHAVDPGWVPTRMGGRSAPDDLAAGHQTQAWLATHPQVTPSIGGYWYHRHTQSPHPAATDKLLALLSSSASVHELHHVADVVELNAKLQVVGTGSVRPSADHPLPSSASASKTRPTRKTADRGATPESLATSADRLAWLVVQSGVSPESAGWESLAGADRSMSSLPVAQLASRFRASCEGVWGSAV